MLKNSEPVVQNITLIVVELTACCDGARTIFTFPNSPIHFVTSGVYRYNGLSNFPNSATGIPLEPGKCYTAAILTLSPSLYPQGPPTADIPIIDGGCQNALCIDACAEASCGCPPEYIADTNGRCVKTITTTPTGGTVMLSVINCVSHPTWGGTGAWFFDDVSTLPKPLTALPSPPPWTLVDDLGVPCPINTTVFNSLWKFRLKDVGVWASGFTPGVPQGIIGFSFCFDFPESKVYYFGISCDDYGTLAIDGVLIIDTAPYVTWTVLPIFIAAGQRVINLTMEDIGSVASGLGLEIYDVPNYATLQACTTATGVIGVPNPGNPTDLSQYILLSTLQKKTPPGQFWDTGQYNGFDCPTGSVLSTCGTPVCVQISYAEKTTCNIKLTPCCGEGDPVIVAEDAALLAHVGQVVCIQDIDPFVGCWTIDTTTELVTFTGIYTPGNYTATCEQCVSLNCKTCIDDYFIFTDCCTGDPLVIPACEICTPAIVIFNWTGLSTNGVTPSSIGSTTCINDLVINSFSYEGCWKLTSIVKPLLPDPTKFVLNWDTIEDVTIVPSTDCPDCRVCYILENCLDETDILVTGTDLSAYLGQVISIESCKDKTYIVTLAENCDNCTEAVTVIISYDACLPIPVPVIPPLQLNTRPVKPGYTTPGCSPEYTEKVNANFSDQVYAQMLSVRYGLTTCCQEDLDYWDIKKELLDLKAINDNNLTDCNNV